MHPVLALFSFCVVLCLSRRTELEPTPNGAAIFRRMAEAHNFDDSKNVATSFTLFGKTAVADPGSHQRIIDVVGAINPVSGALNGVATMSAVIQGEVIADGISAYDFNSNEVYYASDGAFGGTVFYANLNNLTSIPPQAYYLLPVVFLGYDPVSGSRLIAGVNTPTKSFLIMDKPNWGMMTLFLFPAELIPSANDVFDGKTMNYYSAVCAQAGKCVLYTWNIETNKVTSFSLACIPPAGFLTAELSINPATRQIQGLGLTTANDYYVVSIDVHSQSCKVSGSLTNLPPKPVIIVATEVGYLSGNLYISLSSNAYNAINVYDSQLKFIKQIKTGQYLAAKSDTPIIIDPDPDERPFCRNIRQGVTKNKPKMLTLFRSSLPETVVNTVVQACGVVSSGWCLGHYVYSWYSNSIPSRVPIQFGLDGSANVWVGDKSKPVVGTLAFALFPLLSTVFPLKQWLGWGRINYLWPLTEANQAKQRFHAVSLLLDTSLALALFIPFLQYEALNVAIGSRAKVPEWIVRGLLAALLLPAAGYFYNSYKDL